MNSKNIAFLLAFITSIIYGLNYTIAKDVMPIYIKPYGFILLRVLGGTLLFWIVGFFAKKEKIAFQDFTRIILASIFGTALNMLAFFKGLSLTSPISAAVIMVSTPILVLIFATFFKKEKVTKKKLAGIMLGMAGAIVLIVYGQDFNSGENALFGNLLILVNAASYSLYLILIKNLTDKYHPLTFAKWIYLFGLIFVTPFGLSEVLEINWQLIPIDGILKISYVIVFTTFIAYMFNLFAIDKLNPTTLSVFIYLQPVIASIYALFVGSDSLSLVKVLATLLIFSGVYLVTKKSKVDEPQ